MRQRRHAGGELANHQPILHDPGKEPGVALRVRGIGTPAHDRNRGTAHLQRPPMRGAVDAQSQSAHHRNAQPPQRAAQCSGSVPPPSGAPPGAHHPHPAPAQQRRVPAKEEHGGRVRQVVQPRRIGGLAEEHHGHLQASGNRNGLGRRRPELRVPAMLRHRPADHRVHIPCPGRQDGLGGPEGSEERDDTPQAQARQGLEDQAGLHLVPVRREAGAGYGVHHSSGSSPFSSASTARLRSQRASSKGGSPFRATEDAA